MATQKLYAVNKYSALCYANMYYGSCVFLLGSSQCACGETPTLFIQVGDTEIRILICEACFMEAAHIDRVPVYFDEDITKQEILERYNTAVENSDFVVIGDQEYSTETIQHILDEGLI